MIICLEYHLKAAAAAAFFLFKMFFLPVYNFTMQQFVNDAVSPEIS
jgi:hypothetical protein